MTRPPNEHGVVTPSNSEDGLSLQDILARFIDTESKTEVIDAVTRTIRDELSGDRTVFVQIDEHESTIGTQYHQASGSNTDLPQAVLELAVKSYTCNSSAVIDDRFDVRCSAVTHPAGTQINRARSLMLVPFADEGVLTVTADGPAAFAESELVWAEQVVACGERTLDHLQEQRDVLQEVGDILAHDIHGPLQVATGRLALAKSTGEPSHFERVEDAHQRLADLIDGVVTLIRTGDRIAATEPVDLAAEAEDVWDFIGASEATLEIQAPITIEADRNCLRQILENLFRNAIEHGDSDVTVTVGTHKIGFYVEDDGPGIPPERRTEVLETGVSSAGKQSGLGLSIVKRLVEAHGWTIGIESADDGGTRVEIETSP